MRVISGLNLDFWFSFKILKFTSVAQLTDCLLITLISSFNCMQIKPVPTKFDNETFVLFNHSIPLLCWPCIFSFSVRELQ